MVKKYVQIQKIISANLIKADVQIIDGLQLN